jgi:hypothetical protein
VLKSAVPGDGLYADDGNRKAVPGLGLGFIFTRKDESRPWIAGQSGWYPENAENYSLDGAELS